MRRLLALGLAAAVAPLGVVADACGGGRPVSQPRDRVVTLTIRYSHFVPDRIEVSPGTTVRFVVRNTDPIDHEFIVGDQAVQDRHEHGTDRHHDAPGEISIPAESTGETSWTFGAPGALQYACHLPGHYAFGMRGVVTITG